MSRLAARASELAFRAGHLLDLSGRRSQNDCREPEPEAAGPGGMGIYHAWNRLWPSGRNGVCALVCHTILQCGGLFQICGREGLHGCMRIQPSNAKTFSSWRAGAFGWELAPASPMHTTPVFIVR